MEKIGQAVVKGKIDRKSTKREKNKLFDLQKLKVTQVIETISLRSNTMEKTSEVSLKSVMLSYGLKISGMSLFLTLFQRHVRKANLHESEWEM